MVGIQIPIVFYYSEMEKLGFRMFGIQNFTVMTDHASQKMRTWSLGSSHTRSFRNEKGTGNSSPWLGNS